MEQLKKDIAKFHGGFEDLIISLHKVFLDVKSKIKSEKTTNSALESGKNGLAELDRLIDQCMKNLSENQNLQEDLMQFLVSYRPRLENEINLIEDSLKNPTNYEETPQDDELNQILQDAETEILRTIQDEKDKMEQIKMLQMKKQSESEYFESQKIFEQQEQMREAFKIYEKQQQEQKKNSWLNDDEIQNLRDKRRNQSPLETNFNLDTTNNWCSPFGNIDNDNDTNNVDNKDDTDNISPKSDTEDDDEQTNENYENDQEIANRLLFQFLGIPVENQNNDNEKDKNKNDEENEEIKTEESNSETNQNEEKKIEENQEESNNSNRTDLNVSNEKVGVNVSTE